MKTYFDHEKLDVYREAIAFCAWTGDLLNAITAKAAAKDQLDRASTSIPLNIAEGNGKFSAKDRARFLEIARVSARGREAIRNRARAGARARLRWREQ
jgi:four helix bundle protein